MYFVPIIAVCIYSFSADFSSPGATELAVYTFGFYFSLVIGNISIRMFQKLKGQDIGSVYIAIHAAAMTFGVSMIISLTIKLSELL